MQGVEERTLYVHAINRFAEDLQSKFPDQKGIYGATWSFKKTNVGMMATEEMSPLSGGKSGSPFL